jgi:hypothetical protein
MDGWPFWHVTLTVAGAPVGEDSVAAGLERLSHAHPFLLSGRYACDRAEVRYWEEGPDAPSVVAMALGLWREHTDDCGLPHWRVVGVEVLDRETFHRRGRADVRPLSPVGLVPF